MISKVLHKSIVNVKRDLALTIDIPKKVFSRSFTKIDLVGVWLNIRSSVSCKGQN